VRHDALKVAQRCEAELGDEQIFFVEGCQRDWEDLPIPDGPITVGIDGGYVRDWDAKQWNFEVIVGKRMLAFKRDDEQETPSSKCFGFVQTFDTKPKRRLFEVLKSQGMQMNQQITFLSDGGDTVRDLQLYLGPEAEHIICHFDLALLIQGQLLAQKEILCGKGRGWTQAQEQEAQCIKEKHQQHAHERHEVAEQARASCHSQVSL
jgi:hypothetical protein